MKTLTVDDQKRRVVKEAKDSFPPGSLKKYVTRERNNDLLKIFKGCSLEDSE